MLVNNHQVRMTSCRICAMKQSMGWKKKMSSALLTQEHEQGLETRRSLSLFSFPFFRKKTGCGTKQLRRVYCAHFFPSPQLCLVSISPILLGVHLPNSAWCWHLGSLNLTLQGACISEKSANTKNQGVFSSFQAAGNETFPSIHWLFPPRLRWFRVMLIEQMHVKEGVKAEI